MVTSAGELRHARRALLRVMGELREEGVPFGEAVPVGVMIDTPAAALICGGAGPRGRFSLMWEPTA